MSWKNAGCHQLLTEGLRKSDERDQELQNASHEIGRLNRSLKSMQSAISASEPHRRIYEAEQKVYRLLAVAVIYVHTVSKQQARDMATEALDSTSFTRELEHTHEKMEARLKESMLKHLNSNEYETIRPQVEELEQRVIFVEQAMDAYTSGDEETGLTLQEPSAEDGD